MTNELAQHDPQAAQQESNVRWLNAQSQHEAKQLASSPACQGRLARSQRNSNTLALRPWTCLKRLAGLAKTSAH